MINETTLLIKTTNSHHVSSMNQLVFSGLKRGIDDCEKIGTIGLKKAYLWIGFIKLICPKS